MVTIRHIESLEDIGASQKLRFRVWSQQEGVMLKGTADGCIADELDKTAYHWGAFDGDVLVGSARLSIHSSFDNVPDAELYVGSHIPLPTASMNRLVVDRFIRGNGIARALDKTRIQFARESGLKSVVVTPVTRGSRVSGLLDLGFLLLNASGVAKWSIDVPVTAMWLPLDRGC